MKNRFKLLIMASAFLCLSLAQVAVADSCQKIIYIDGNQVVDVCSVDYNIIEPNGLYYYYSSSQGGDGIGGDRITIGGQGHQWYLYNEYVGKIADFALYSGILSEPCIAAHRNAGIGSDYTAYANTVLHDNPLLYLKFDDASVLNGATATNYGSATARNGTYITRGTSKGFTQISSSHCSGGGKALVFPDSCDSGSGSCVDVWDDGTFDYIISPPGALNGRLTVELWVDFNSIGDTPGGDYPRFFQHNGNWQFHGAYGMMLDENHADLNTIAATNGGGDVEVNYCRELSSRFGTRGELNDSNWHHIVVTYDSTYAYHKPPPPANLPPDNNTYEAEVLRDNPVLWLRFEDEQPKDYSVYDGNHWVGYGGAASIVDKVGGIGKSLLLTWPSGAAPYAGVYAAAATNNANSPPVLYPGTGQQTYEVFGDKYGFLNDDPNLTFELWYKTLPPNQRQPSTYAVFFQQIGVNTNEPNAPGVTLSGPFQIRVFGGSGAWYVHTDPRLDGKWHQLVVTYAENYQGAGDPEPNMHAQLYLDATLIEENTFVTTNVNQKARLGPELSHIVLGAENDMGSSYNVFSGYMDEFAIYKGILDPNRILYHYAAWQPKNCPEVVARGLESLADADGNCKINFYDFASFANNWRKCNDPCGNAHGCPGCSPGSCPESW